MFQTLDEAMASEEQAEYDLFPLFGSFESTEGS